jgi:hypothetical protein
MVSRPIESTSKFAVLAAVSLMPVVAVFVFVNAIATATTDRSTLDVVLPRGFDGAVRLLLVVALVVFVLVRLWIMMARSVAVEQAATVMDEAVQRVERKVAAEPPFRGGIMAIDELDELAELGRDSVDAA